MRDLVGKVTLLGRHSSTGYTNGNVNYQRLDQDRKCQGKGKRKEKGQEDVADYVLKKHTWKYPRSRHALAISSTTQDRVVGSRR